MHVEILRNFKRIIDLNKTDCNVNSMRHIHLNICMLYPNQNWSRTVPLCCTYANVAVHTTNQINRSSSVWCDKGKTPHTSLIYPSIFRLIFLIFKIFHIFILLLMRVRTHAHSTHTYSTCLFIYNHFNIWEKMDRVSNYFIHFITI